MDKNLKEKILLAGKKSFKYVEVGQGPLVLLVHGWPESWYSWRHQLPEIAKLGFKTVAFNLRGYADSFSPLDIQEYSMKNFMKDILDIIDYFNVKDTILIGHDWGAPICWNTAAIYKSRVKAVIGLSVPYSGRGEISSTKLWENLYKDIFFYQNYFQKIGVAEKELEKNIEESIKKIYYWCSGEGFYNNVKTLKDLDSGLLDGISLPPNGLNWLSEKDISFYVEEFNKSGFRGPLNRYRNQETDWLELPELSNLRISQPSLFIGGEHDPVRYFIKNYDAYKDPGKLCNNLLGSFIIKRVGHWVQQENPKEVNSIIKKFLLTLF